MKFATSTIVALAAIPVSFAFSPHSVRQLPCANAPTRIMSPLEYVERNTKLFSTTDSEETSSGIELSDDEMTLVNDLASRAADDAAALQDLVAQELPKMHPALILKLRQAEQQVSGEVTKVAQALRKVLDSSLEGGRQLLSELLNAGEIRKLDAAIGKAARQGQLDMAFFTVLNTNLQEAMQSVGTDSDNDDDKANRQQILQHIYTRCQEEVEKNVPGGVALLNKLLRTEIDSIRVNQLEHYLCPQPNVITTPDGKEVKLEGIQPTLVPPQEFVEALANAVKQIRTVEKAGGADPVAAANMVESCRQVAKEARLIIGNHYGVESDELRKFEDGLQPVFRPDSPESPYIQGD